jgi:hypothetical protein
MKLAPEMIGWARGIARNCGFPAASYPLSCGLQTRSEKRAFVFISLIFFQLVKLSDLS